MPQMAPLSWVSLFLMFTMVFMLFNPLNYYLIMYKTKTTKSEKTVAPIFWKW